MALMEITIVPIGTGSTSVGDYVAEALRVLKERGVDFHLEDMGTIVSGEVDELLEVARRLHETPFGKGAKRVYTVIRIDDRRDKAVGLGEKARSVLERS